MDFGYPQFTEAKILSEFIKTDAYRMEVGAGAAGAGEGGGASSRGWQQRSRWRQHRQGASSTSTSTNDRCQLSSSTTQQAASVALGRASSRPAEQLCEHTSSKRTCLGQRTISC